MIIFNVNNKRIYNDERFVEVLYKIARNVAETIEIFPLPAIRKIIYSVKSYSVSQYGWPIR
jgi:hypothetical protein